MVQFIVIVVLVFLPLVALMLASQRHLRLFRVEAEQGEITAIAGRMPPRLLGDLKDVIAMNKPKRLRLICRWEAGRAVVEFGPEDASDLGLRQIIRNLVGQYPALRLKRAPRI